MLETFVNETTRGEWSGSPLVPRTPYVYPAETAVERRR
jgi:hypothetical protein